jgi:hypothetical protein
MGDTRYRYGYGTALPRPPQIPCRKKLQNSATATDPLPLQPSHPIPRTRALTLQNSLGTVKRDAKNTYFPERDGQELPSNSLTNQWSPTL